MKKLICILLIITAFVLPGFTLGKQESPRTIDRTKAKQLNVFVSILPQTYFLEKIGGNRLNIEVMVKAGMNPATYEPSPAQISALSEADAFFTIGVPFEKAFIPKIKSTIPRLNIVDTSKNITRKPMSAHGVTKTDSPDPHIWMSPKLVKIQAQNIFDALVLLDPKGKETYLEGLAEFNEELDFVDNKIENSLEAFKGKPFFIFHPSMGYFADSYELRQVAVEAGGKQPSVAEISTFIEKARTQGVKIVFVQPEFSKEGAGVIAAAIGGSVVTLTPLNPDYINNLSSMSDEIRKAYN